MFDPAFDQAAGLRGLEGPTAVRVLPLLLPRDSQPTFDLAWTLGASLSVLGHKVVALDAAGREGVGQPGLAQRLKTASEAAADEPSWQVWPAQSGLQTLLHAATSQGAAAALSRLVSVFDGDTVLLLLAPKEWLGVLFEGTAVRPLVPLVFQPSAVVDAYSALKVLKQAADLNPVLVPMPGDVPAEAAMQAQKALRDTAERHLGWVPESWPMPDAHTPLARDEMTRWVLRMLESALLMEDPGPGQPAWGSSNPREALVPQLWSC